MCGELGGEFADLKDTRQILGSRVIQIEKVRSRTQPRAMVRTFSIHHASLDCMGPFAAQGGSSIRYTALRRN